MQSSNIILLVFGLGVLGANTALGFGSFFADILDACGIQTATPRPVTARAGRRPVTSYPTHHPRS